LPHSPALAKALQLATQAFSMATVTAASAQAGLLTLAGLTTICIEHSIHSKVSDEAITRRAGELHRYADDLLIDAKGRLQGRLLSLCRIAVKGSCYC